MMSRNKKIYQITYVALFVAVISAIAQISIPMPSFVPLTFQLFSVVFVAYLLKTKFAVLTVVCYIAIGTMGAPVFASFKGGFGVLLDYTGGFIWSFVIVAFICAFSARSKCAVFMGIFSVVLSHLFGIIQYMIIARIGFWGAFLTVSLPYLLKDLILAPVAYISAQKILRVIPRTTSNQLGIFNQKTEGKI